MRIAWTWDYDFRPNVIMKDLTHAPPVLQPIPRPLVIDSFKIYNIHRAASRTLAGRGEAHVDQTNRTVCHGLCDRRSAGPGADPLGPLADVPGL